jgi:hypothetical protein
MDNNFSADQTVKRKRGRPRKNVEKNKVEDTVNNPKEESIIMFMALSDDELFASDNNGKIKNKKKSNFTGNESDNISDDIIDDMSDNLSDNILDSENANRFTVNESDVLLNKNKIKSISNSSCSDYHDIQCNSESDIDNELTEKEKIKVKEMVKKINREFQKKIITEMNEMKKTNKILKNEVNRRNEIIISLKNKIKINKKNLQINKINSNSNLNSNSNSNLVANSIVNSNPRCSINSIYFQKTNLSCWWCDHSFNWYPSYIVLFKNDNDTTKPIYVVYGNFCSFNCALKYNICMLRDFKCNCRHSLTLELKIKTTGNSDIVKLADNREMLESKGGDKTIDSFRENFIIIDDNCDLSVCIDRSSKIIGY